MHRKYLDYALSLFADIQAAATELLPGRELVLGWLGDFIRRAREDGFEIADGEIDNLLGLDKFVRVNRLPSSARLSLF